MPKYLVLPKIGMNMEEAVISEWLVQPGDKVEKEQMVVRAETDKAMQDLFATDSGIVYKLLVQPGDVVPCQAKIAILLEDGEVYQEPESVDEAPAAPESAAKTPVAPPAVGQAVGRESAERTAHVRISPLAKKMARDLGISLDCLQPAQPGKRIVKADVERYQQNAASAIEPTQQNHAEGVLQPLSRTRQIIARRMTESAATKPRVSLVTTVDCTKLCQWRENLKKERKVTYNELIAMACAAALKKYPEMNCIREEGGLRVLPDINIGIAVDTPSGLVVPVLKDVGRKGALQLAEEFGALVEKAREGKLQLADMSGGTFSISNLGMFEVESFDPILNAPECFILGVGCMKEQPLVVDHALCVKTCMKLSLSFDHAAFDGASAAKLLQTIKHLLEEPMNMLS